MTLTQRARSWARRLGKFVAALAVIVVLLGSVWAISVLIGLKMLLAEQGG